MEFMNQLITGGHHPVRNYPLFMGKPEVFWDSNGIFVRKWDCAKFMNFHGIFMVLIGKQRYIWDFNGILFGEVDGKTIQQDLRGKSQKDFAWNTRMSLEVR